jgi:hypothetical protein
MGGRKMRSTEHALHAVTHKIYEAWSHNTRQVASLLLLDVSGAFDNVRDVNNQSGLIGLIGSNQSAHSIKPISRFFCINQANPDVFVDLLLS